MNFNELHQIVKHLKKSLECASCSKKYLYDDIEIMSTYEDQGLFNATCFHCQNQILIHVTIGDKIDAKGKSTNHSIKKLKGLTERDHQSIRQHQKTIISSNDVIDIHCFLDKFNGDFKKLFSK